VIVSGQEIFRARDGVFVEGWQVEDIGALLRPLGLEGHPVLRRAALRSARRFEKNRP